jgi:transposase-like protein
MLTWLRSATAAIASRPRSSSTIWLYLRFTLSYRDVEELLAKRGLDISYETVRRWVLKFGPGIARRLRQGRPRPSDRWHFDEMVVRIAGRRMYLWRAVDHEGEILDMLVSAGVTSAQRCGLSLLAQHRDLAIDAQDFRHLGSNSGSRFSR